MPITLIDIPLLKHMPDDLLGIDEENYPDGHPDFYQHGWGVFEEEQLLLMGLNKIVILDRCIVLVVHSTDNPPIQKRDIEAEFWLDEDDIEGLEEDIEIRMSLNKFLNRRIEEIVEKCREEEIFELVLCVCNPHHAIIPRPNIPEDISVYFPKGVVEHWKVEECYELRANNWIIL